MVKIKFFLTILFFYSNSYALQVESYYGKYLTINKIPGVVSPSLNAPVTENWQSPNKLNEPYTIGVLLPHVQNKYWLAVNYGIIEQAKQLGVNIKLYSAGGYGKDGVQRKQLTNNLLVDKVQGIIMASIHYDKYDRFIAQLDKMSIPVISLINEIKAPNIKAKVLISYFQVGYKLGEYVIKQSEGRDQKVAWFPGPENSGWAEDMFQGFVQAITTNPGAYPLGKITIVAKQFGEVNTPTQKKLIDFVLNSKDNIDYIIGNAIAAKVAPTILQQHKQMHPNTRILSTYLSQDLYNHIKDGLIEAAATDLMVEQARIAVDMMVRTLSGEIPGEANGTLPFRVSPIVKIIDKSNLKEVEFSRLFGQEGFSPINQYVAGSEP